MMSPMFWVKQFVKHLGLTNPISVPRRLEGNLTREGLTNQIFISFFLTSHHERSALDIPHPCELLPRIGGMSFGLSDEWSLGGV